MAQAEQKNSETAAAEATGESQSVASLLMKRKAGAKP